MTDTELDRAFILTKWLTTTLVAIIALAAAITAIRLWVLPRLGDDAADVGLVGITAIVTAAATSAVWVIPVAVGRHHKKRR